MMKLFSAFSSFILTYYVKYHHPNTIRHSVKLNYIGNFDHNTSMALLFMFICIFAITFHGCALGADSVWKSTKGTSADHIWNWLDVALDFFHSAGILCTDIFLRDRLPTFIATQFCMGGSLWVRRSPHSTCADCVYSCFYYVCCMGGSLSKPVKRSPHMCLLANEHQPKLSPLFALAPRALMVGPIREHSFWPEHNVSTNSYCR